METVIQLNFYEKKQYSGYACFDLDHTLISPKSGNIFPKNKNDWKLNENVKNVLNEFSNNNWLIVVISNQLSIHKKINKEDFIEKLTNISNLLSINIKFLVSTSNNYYRKPMIGMWDILNNEFSNINQIEHFYCGDAFNNDKLKASDLKFSLNISSIYEKCLFIYPSTLFINDFKITYYLTSKKLSQEFDIKSVLNNSLSYFQIEKYLKKLSFIDDNNKLNEFIRNYKYLFIISPPSSGKTTFCYKYLTEYKRLSKDDYRSKSIYYRNIVENINNKLVFDNTNYSEKNRNEIIDILSNHNINLNQIGFIIRDIDKSVSFYLNNYRCMITKNNSKLLPNVAIYNYFKNISYPKNNYIILSSMILSLDNENIIF